MREPASSTPGRPELPRLYGLYGLRLGSDWELPYRELPTNGSVDVELFEGAGSLFSDAKRRLPEGQEARFDNVPLEGGASYLRWSNLFEFLISPDGRRIAGRALSEGSLESFQTYLLTQVLGVALAKQGVEPLHATVVAVDGRAVGFLGDCGYGKSSLAAAFLQAGDQLVTDDLLVVRRTEGVYHAYPGPPRIKLFPEIARLLLGEQIRGVPMNPATRKLIIPLRPGQVGDQAPLHALYVLRPPRPHSPPQSIRIRDLSPRAGYLELLRNTFTRSVQDRGRLQRQFLLATEMASVVPIRLLSYPTDLDVLPNVRAAILANLGPPAKPAC